MRRPRTAGSSRVAFSGACKQRLIEELAPDEQERARDLDPDRDADQGDRPRRIKGPRLAKVEKVLQEDTGKDEPADAEEAKARGTRGVGELEQLFRGDPLHRDGFAGQ